MKKAGFLIVGVMLGLAAKPQAIPSWKITDVVNYYSRQTDSIYVISFWATYCKPCIAEIPFMQRIIKKNADKKVKLLLVSLDLVNAYPGKIRSMAKKKSISADIVWLKETDADYFCNMIDKKWSGSIPATIIVNAATGYKSFYEKEFKPKEFEVELLKAVNSKK